MCGRITQQQPSDQICDLYTLRGTPLPPDRPPRYNGAPGQDFTACRVDEDGSRAIALLRWGLVPSWPRDAKASTRLINARAETVHNKPSFRAAFRSRRCLLPAGWLVRVAADRKRQAALLPDPGGRLSAVVCRAVGALGPGRRAARDLHHHYHGGLPSLEDLHHRQPAIIDPRWFSDWLDPLAPLPALLELVREPYDGPFERRAVSTQVNSVRNDDPDVLLSVSESGLF